MTDWCSPCAARYPGIGECGELTGHEGDHKIWVARRGGPVPLIAWRGDAPARPTQADSDAAWEKFKRLRRETIGE